MDTGRVGISLKQMEQMAAMIAATNMKVNALYSALMSLGDIIPDARILRTLDLQFSTADDFLDKSGVS